MLPTSSHANGTEPRSEGAQPHNRNALRHGLRGAGLPRGAEHIGRAVNQFRRQLETEVLNARQEITTVDACLINRAFRSERHSALCQWWLARDDEKLSPMERLAFSREVVKGSESRDKAIAELRLPMRPDADVWAGLTLAANNVTVSDADASDSHQEPDA
jgi:hypothetical protein